MESKRKLPLAFWIFVGLLVGIAAGMALMNISVGGIEGKDFAKAYIKPWGDIFLNLLKFVVVPIVLFSIAAGVISMKDISKVGSIGLKTIVYYMCTTAFAVILALILVLCRKGGLAENRPLYWIVSAYINVVRSIPFVILLVTIMPITRAIVGTTIGSTAALVPLVVYISPYLARLMENSLLEINPGILEAAEAMGATTWQVIRYFLVPETLGSMVLALTTGTIGLLGASAMAGYVGGGGVGDLALTYGYEKMNTPLMILTVVILVVLVQLLQILGNTISGKLRQHK